MRCGKHDPCYREMMDIFYRGLMDETRSPEFRWAAMQMWHREYELTLAECQEEEQHED